MIKYPSYQEIVNRIRADVAANLPGTDPTIFGSYLRGLADSLGGRSYDIVLLAKQLANELFPQTSSGEYLERWAGYEGLSRNSATVASGPVTFTGPAGTAIAAGTQFRGADNAEIYATLVGISLATNSQDLATLSRVASIATATTGSEHNLATGMSVTISGAQQIITGIVRAGSTATATTSGDHYLTSGNSVTITGADQAEYNGTFIVTVMAADTFDYTVSGTPDTPATGAIFRSVTGYNGTYQITATDATSFAYELSSTPPLIANNASVAWDGNFANIESVNIGINTNLDPGAQLIPVTPIGGVDVRAYVQPGGVSGGTDDETDESLRIRTLQSRSNPVANFNVAAIEKTVLSVPGVTRVLVKRIYPAVGSVTILFLRDNDVNPIPDATEIQQVKDVIYPIVPAHSSLDDVYIQGPSPIVQNFRFFAIDPDTPSMREAITQNLIAFFQDEVEFETDVTDDKYGAAIINTIDPLNGDVLTSFLLSDPSGDIVVGDEEIAILGTVTFE